MCLKQGINIKMLKNIMVIKMYFRLNPECYFIRGIQCGAIFDLIDMRIYTLNQQETNIVTSCEKNEPISSDETFLNELKKLRLGNFYPQKIYVQKLRMGQGIKKSKYAAMHEMQELHRVFLEINNLCNRDCWFCGYYGVKRSLGCIGCNKWRGNTQSLDLERCRKIIDEISDLDCRDLHITGGDLTLAWDKAMDVLDYAQRKFRNIFMTLHQHSISPDILNDLSGKAQIIVQTDNLSNIQPKESVTLLVVEPEDSEKALDTEGRNIIKSLAIKDYNTLFKDLPMLSKSKISPLSISKFLSNIEYHPCLGHTLSICYDGNVTPCPMMRNYSFGNVNDVELSVVLEKKWDNVDKFWKLNLDEIDKCTGCEFRYVCFDCRALEESLTGTLNGKILCNYNPREGKWP